MKLKTIFIISLILKFFDMLTTYIGVGFLGCYEANYVPNLIFKYIGVGCGSLLLFLLSIYLHYFLYSRGCRKILIFACTALTFIVINNTIGIYKSLDYRIMECNKYNLFDNDICVGINYDRSKNSQRGVKTN